MKPIIATVTNYRTATINSIPTFATPMDLTSHIRFLQHNVTLQHSHISFLEKLLCKVSTQELVPETTVFWC